MDRWSIGKLASAANVSADTVRYYERMGLLAPPARAKSGYRSYGEADLRRLLAIRRARAVGFSIQEIAALLAIQPGAEGCPDARMLLQKKLAAIDIQVAELTQWRAVLLELLTLAPLGTSLETLLAAPLRHDDTSTDTSSDDD